MKLAVLIIVFLSHTFAQPVSYNSDQIYSKSYSFDLDSLYNSRRFALRNKSLTLSYEKTIQQSPMVALISFQQLVIDYSNSKIDIFATINSTNNTALIILLSSCIDYGISRLIFRTFIAGAFTSKAQKFSMGEIQIEPLKGISKMIKYSQVLPLSNQLASASLAIYSSLIGFSLSANYPYIIDVNVEMKKSGSSINIDVTSQSSQATYVESVRVNWFMFDSSFFEKKLVTAVNSIKVVDFNNPSSYVLASKQEESKHMFGMSGFSMTRNNQFSFQFYLDKPNTLYVEGSNTFTYFTYNILSANPTVCVYVENRCQEQCPARYYQNYLNMTCRACPYDCYTCNQNNECLSCDQAHDFRVLSSKRCLPKQGYVQSGKAVADKSYASHAKQNPVVPILNNNIEVKNMSDGLTVNLKIAVGITTSVLAIIIALTVYKKLRFRSLPRVRPQNQQIYIQNHLQSHVNVAAFYIRPGPLSPQRNGLPRLE